MLLDKYKLSILRVKPWIVLGLKTLKWSLRKIRSGYAHVLLLICVFYSIYIFQKLHQHRLIFNLYFSLQLENIFTLSVKNVQNGLVDQLKSEELRPRSACFQKYD